MSVGFNPLWRFGRLSSRSKLIRKTNLTRHGRMCRAKNPLILTTNASYFYPREIRKNNEGDLTEQKKAPQWHDCLYSNKFIKGLCEGNSDYKGVKISYVMCTLEHSSSNIILTTTLNLNALLLCKVKQPTLEWESTAYVYLGLISRDESQHTPEAQGIEGPPSDNNYLVWILCWLPDLTDSWGGTRPSFWSRCAVYSDIYNDKKGELVIRSW